MKILIVSNQIKPDGEVGNPILKRMGTSMCRDQRVEAVEYISVKYTWSGLAAIREKAKTVDVCHVHFGGLYVLAVWLVLIGTSCQKIITFHGTDIHAKGIDRAKGIKEKVKIRLNQWASFFSIVLFKRAGFVAAEMQRHLPMLLKKCYDKKMFIQQLGVDYQLFHPKTRTEALLHLGLTDKHYILFSDISNANIKRRDIAEAVVKEFNGKYDLLIMSKVLPEEVPFYIDVCDFLLLTSDEEGSPNIIRECLSLNKPVFSVDVGDVRQQLAGLHNSAIIERDPVIAAQQIRNKMSVEYTDNTRETRRNMLDFDYLNKATIDLYQQIIIK